MTAPVAQPARLDIGRVLKDTLEVLKRRLLPFALLQLAAVAVPGSLVAMAAYGGFKRQHPGVVLPLIGAIMALGVCLIVAQAAIIHASAMVLTNDHRSLVQSVGAALRKAPLLIAMALLQAAAVVVGYLLLIVPGVLLSVIWAVSSPCLMLGGAGLFGSMSASAALTRNNRWPTLGLMVLYMVVTWIVDQVLQTVISLSLMGAHASLTVSIIAAGGVGIIFNEVVRAAGTAALYVNLRRLQQGTDTIAAVFD